MIRNKVVRRFCAGLGYASSFSLLAMLIQHFWNFFAPALKGHMTFGQAMNLTAMAVMLSKGIEIPFLLYTIIIERAPPPARPPGPKASAPPSVQESL